MSEQRAKVDGAIAAWNAGHLDGYLALYDPTIRLHGYSPDQLRKDEVRGFYEGIWAAFPGSQLVFHDVIEHDDRIVLRFTMTGRHDGDFMGVGATGTEIAVDGITILRFGGESGQVVERWSSADMLGLLVQLGAMPAPA